MNLAILVVGPCKDLKVPSLWLHKHCADMSKQIFSMSAKSDELFIVYILYCMIINVKEKEVSSLSNDFDEFKDKATQTDITAKAASDHLATTGYIQLQEKLSSTSISKHHKGSI